MTGTKQKAGKGSKIATLLIIVVALASLIWKGDDLYGLLLEKPTDSVFGSPETVAVHFIDVGQGACTLIQSGTDGILIDAGERDYADRVIKYIKDSGVKKLAYVIATHPHSDHIGAMADVLRAIPTERIIMPRLTLQNTPTTKCYEYMLKAIQSQGIEVIDARYGQTFGIDHASLTILGPNEQNESLNEMSVVCRLTAYSTSFMLLADAGKQEMRTILDRNPVLKSNVLSMGHHGSSKSLLYKYLNKVDPDVAVISCGTNNDYGYPHKETLKYLRENKIRDYRTDLQSHIVFVCSETGYRVQTAA